MLHIRSSSIPSHAFLEVGLNVTALSLDLNDERQ